MLRKICLFLLLVIPFSLWFSQGVRATHPLRRITITSEVNLNLNPSLSGDGSTIAFESTADLASTGGSGFHALRSEVSEVSVSFAEVSLGRAPAPTLSQDGSWIAFASTENLLGTNQDGNFEIFLSYHGTLTQITDTTASSEVNRISQGNFQPSISDDGQFVAFSSNRDLTGQNSDNNLEVFVFNTSNLAFTQITNTTDIPGASSAKISGNGNRIAYIRDTTATRDLIVLPREEPGSFQLVAQDVTSLMLAYGRAISDDGSRVIYSAETGANASQLFLWDGRNNVTRQLTQLGVSDDDVPLQASFSGDGSRVAFATRRNVIGGNTDHSVELYVLDIPSGQIEAITDAPAGATAEVVSSLNDDGSLVTFSFPRILVGPVSSTSFANNSEIFLAGTTPRPLFGSLSIANGASNVVAQTEALSLAPASIAVARGSALSFTSQEGERLPDKTFPLTLAGTSVTVNGRSAQVLFVSETQVNFVVPAATELGSAEIIVTNADGFRSRTTVSITRAAPGLFTSNGEGFGPGVILNADTLQIGPFNPAEGNLRLSLFATGVRNAFSTSVIAAGHPLVLESINASPELPGLDELHVLVPPAFQGAGTIQLFVRADGQISNAAEVVLTGDAVRDVLINEVLADPPDGLAGDANHDGVRSSSEDEFIELVNAGSAVNLSGWTIRTRALNSASETIRHRFASDTLLLANEVIVIFGGGNFDPGNPMFGCARVIQTSTAGLSLTNSGLTILLRDGVGNLVTEFTYGGATGLAGDNNQSLTRSPDITGTFVQHSSATGANGLPFSPGLRIDGTPLANCPGRLNAIRLSNSTATIMVGEMISLIAQPIDFYGRPMANVMVTFVSDNPAVAIINAVMEDDVNRTFTANISSHSVGLAHIEATATEGETTLSAVCSIVVMSPSTSSLIVINQIYGGGNNAGATFQNDFVELFNRGTSLIDFSAAPYSIQYASAAGSFSNTNKLNLTTGSIAPGQYFLIRLAGGTTNGAILPPADASNTAINLSSTDGKVALVVGTDVLSGNGCPLSNEVADFVGYGSANCAEGVAVGSLNATRSARRQNRCTDTNANNLDFAVITNPAAPQNSTAPPQPCP